MEKRAREGMAEETLGQLRRGWLLGGDASRDRVSDFMAERAGMEGRKIRGEEADSDHGHRQAERIIVEMRRALEMSEPEILAARKGDWRKRVIAQRVRQETSVSLRWLGARLAMGSEGHVSRVSRSLEDLAQDAGWRSFRAAQAKARKKDCPLLPHPRQDDRIR